MFSRLFLLFCVVLLVSCQEARDETPLGETAVPIPTIDPEQPTTVVTAVPTAVPATDIVPSMETAETAESTTQPPTDPAPTEQSELPPTPPPLTSEWDTRQSLLEANSEMAVAELDGKIYVLGGYPSSRVTVTSVQIYDSATDSWTLGPSLPGPVNHTTAVSVNGKLYVLGGQSTAAGGGPFLDTVFEFDPLIGEWALKAPMPRARGGGAAAVVNDRIYVAGGRPPHGTDFAVYDPLADSWTVLPDVPTGRNHIAAAAINGLVYVVGGRFGSGFRSEMTNVVEVYNPLTNLWTEVAPMPTVRGGINAAVVNGCLHIFGGEGGSGMFAEHEVYDPVTDVWFSLPPMATAVHGVTGSAVIGGWIHLPGGGTAVGGSSGSTIHQVVQTEIVCHL